MLHVNRIVRPSLRSLVLTVFALLVCWIGNVSAADELTPQQQGAYSMYVSQAGTYAGLADSCKNPAGAQVRADVEARIATLSGYFKEYMTAAFENSYQQKVKSFRGNCTRLEKNKRDYEAFLQALIESDQPQPQEKPVDKDAFIRAMMSQTSEPAVSEAEIQQESTQVLEHCKGQQTYSTYNDCDCISKQFIVERRKRPTQGLDPVQVANTIPASACPNRNGIKTFQYDQCKQSYARKMPTGLEEFCACFADEFLQAYLQLPSSGMRAITGHGAAAMSACDAKGMASPLNPNR